jgi:hypothetical protein
MTENISRQPKGIPVGGQFASTSHAEPGLVLGQPAPEVHFDVDGTEWDWKDADATILASSSLGGIGIQINTKTDDGSFSYDVVDYGRGRKVASGSAATLTEAKDTSKHDWERAVRYSKRFGIKEGYPTPWGSADHVTHLAPGVASVSTPGHGGVKLSPARNKEVDPIWRQGDGFYEEDTLWSVTAITHPEGFSEDHQRYAHESARRWYPDEYEAVVGKDPAKYGVTDYKPIAPGESLVRDEKVFFAENADKVQRAWSASYSKDHPGMTEVTVSDVTSTGMRGDNPTRTILVPSGEYEDLRSNNFRTFPKDAPYQVITPFVLPAGSVPNAWKAPEVRS